MSDQAIRFGERLRAGRKAKKLTQDAVAKDLGVSQPTVSAWESGEAYPTNKNVLGLARLYDEDPAGLLLHLATEAHAVAPA